MPTEELEARVTVLERNVRSFLKNISIYNHGWLLIQETIYIKYTGNTLELVDTMKHEYILNSLFAKHISDTNTHSYVVYKHL